MFVCEKVPIRFPNNFRMGLEPDSTKKNPVHCGKAALTILEVNEIRQVIHQRGQEALLAGQRVRDAMAFFDVPAEAVDVPRLVLRTSAYFEAHFQETNRWSARRDDPKSAAEFFAFVQASSNLLSQSRAIAQIHQREKVLVLARETFSLKTKKGIHLGVPSHDSLEYIPLISSNPGRIQGEYQVVSRHVAHFLTELRNTRRPVFAGSTQFVAFSTISKVVNS